MGVSKVVYGDTPILDITDSTVTPQNLLSGEVAYSASGNRVVGEIVTTTVEANPAGTPTDELNSIQIGNDIYEIPLKDKDLPYNCIVNSDYIDKELLEYFLGRIKTVYNVDLHNKFFIVSLGYGTSWWDYSSYIDSPSYTFYVPDSTILSSDGLFELAFPTGKDFSNFELYNSDCYFTAPQYNHITYYSFLARTIGPQLDNGWDLSSGNSTSSFQLFGDPTPYHISNGHYDMYVNVRYPVYVSRPFYTEDSNNVKKCILEGDFALINLNDVKISDLTNGQILVFNSTTNKWENANTVGGHTILNDNGISLAQESNLQFKGTYSHDDSTNGKTVVEVTRSMTRAEFDQLTPAEKKGVISITDESGLPWKDVTGVLPAGETEITLYGDVQESSSIDIYTDKFEVNPTNIEIGSGGYQILQEMVTEQSELSCTPTASAYFESNPPWKAFAAESQNTGWAANGNGNPTWFKVDFGESVGLKKVEYTSADPNRKQTISGIQYSNDENTWSECLLSSNEYGEAILSSKITARYFRFYWTETYGFSTYPMFTCLKMYDYNPSAIIVTFPAQAENLNVKVRIS